MRRCQLFDLTQPDLRCARRATCRRPHPSTSVDAAVWVCPECGDRFWIWPRGAGRGMYRTWRQYLPAFPRDLAGKKP